MEREKLEACGVQYEEGLHRFSGHENIYLKYLNMMPDLEIYEDMKKAFFDGNCHAAFDECHKLKAFIGNLSIHPLYEEICDLTEDLRLDQGISEEMKMKLEKIDSLFKQVVSAIQE